MYYTYNTPMSIISYNYKIPVEYIDTTEYRECFRQAFRIDTERILAEMKRIYPQFDEFEEETKDELLFDEPKVNEIMGDILTMTMFAEPFREFYKRAASFVISDVPDIGLAILLAYDFFRDFHSVLVEWFEWLELQELDVEENPGEKRKLIEDLRIWRNDDQLDACKRVEKFIASTELAVFFENSVPMKKLRERLWT